MVSNYQFKILLLGDYNTGVTSIIERYVKDIFPYDKTKTTSSRDYNFLIKEIIYSNKRIRLNLWNYPLRKFREPNPSWYRGGEAAIIIYDINEKSTFNNIPKYVQDIQRYSSLSQTFIYIVGNKYNENNDNNDNDNEVILSALEYCKLNQFTHFLVSAKTSYNIQLLFETISNSLYEKAEHEQQLEQQQQISNSTESKKNCIIM